ncbi:MAG: FG-GAP-like repeat-containing protein [Bacteroidales bacterium]|nr:FG-GAP-like repeat-containing protein [Bacteroidales bacterium]
MKTIYAFFSLFFLVNTSNAQQCCNITPLTGIGGPDPQPNTAFGIAIADIDNDGDGDIAFHAAYENTFIYKNVNGTFQLSQTFTYSNDDSWQYGLNFADIDNDGDKDLVTSPQWSNAKMYVYKNNGSGTFSVWQTVNTWISCYNKAMDDIDNDGDIDIVAASAGSGAGFQVFKNNGSGTFTQTQSLTGEGGRTVAIADVDGDGDKDAVVATMYYGTGIRIFKNNGTGTFTMDSQEIIVNNSDYHSVVVADFNNDGKPDIAAGTGSWYIHVFKNLGNGLFTFIRELQWEPNWVSYYMQLRSADMDGDGRRDLIASSYSGGITVWRCINNDFEFVPCYRSTLANYGHGMDIGDLNNDGKIDIVGCNANDLLAYVFLNNGGISGQPASANNNSPVCAGQNVQLFASPSGASYQWSGPNNYSSSQQNPIITNINSAQAGTYTVNVVGSNCYNKATTTVTLYQTPIVNAGNDQSISYNSSTQLNGSVSGGSGNYTIQWSPSNLLNNANILNPTTVNLTQSQSFILSVTDNSSGCSSSDTVLITITGTALSASIQAANNYVCQGNSIQLTALGTGGTGNYTYQWSSVPSGFSSNSQQVTVSPTANTTYTVSINDGVTTATASITITVKPLPNVSITINPPYCAYDNIQLFANSNAQTYSWTGSNGFSSNVQNPVVGQLSPGAYWFTVTVTDQFGCTNYSTTSFNVHAQPQAQAVAQPDSLNLYFTNTANFYGINSGNIQSWNWIINNQNYTTQNVTYTFNQVGTYPVQLIVQNTNGCYDTLVFNYVVYNLALPLSVTIQASATDICIGQSTQLQAVVSGGSGMYTFSWGSNPSGFSSSNQTVNVSPSTNTTYFVTVSDGYNSQVASVAVNVHPQPSITAWSDSPYCTYETIQLHASDAYTYLWTGSNGFTSTQQNPIVGNLPAGTYNYTVVVSDIYGCTNSVTITVNVHNQPIAQAFLLPDSLDISQSNTVNFYGINVGGSITGWNWTINNQTFNTQNVTYTFTQTGTYPVQLIVKNAYDCYDTLTFNYVVYNSTSNMPHTMQDVKVYPNPTKESIYVQSNNLIQQIEIFDIYGKLIKEIHLNSPMTKINVSNFSTGIYFMKIMYNHQIESTIIIKE